LACPELGDFILSHAPRSELGLRLARCCVYGPSRREPRTIPALDLAVEAGMTSWGIGGLPCVIPDAAQQRSGIHEHRCRRILADTVVMESG
jgi:hypothetical protein